MVAEVLLTVAVTSRPLALTPKAVGAICRSIAWYPAGGLNAARVAVAVKLETKNKTASRMPRGKRGRGRARSIDRFLPAAKSRGRKRRKPSRPSRAIDRKQSKAGKAEGSESVDEARDDHTACRARQ